jgi:hypothetical protein
VQSSSRGDVLQLLIAGLFGATAPGLKPFEVFTIEQRFRRWS